MDLGWIGSMMIPGFIDEIGIMHEWMSFAGTKKLSIMYVAYA